MRFLAAVFSLFVLIFCGVYFFYPNETEQTQTAAVEHSVPGEAVEGEVHRLDPPMPASDAPAHTMPLIPKAMIKSEVMERERARNYVTLLLINSDFKQLEELAEYYRSRQERTPSGLWYLSFFYQGVDRYLQTVRSKPMNQPAGVQWTGSADDMHAKIFNAWQAAFPKSPTPLLAQAIRLRAQAWRIRGGSYAHDVPQEAWQPFYETLKAARDLLINHRAVAAQDPEWYRLRINIATELGEPAETVMDTLTQATEAEPYYYTTYFAASRHFLSKWGGDPKYIPAVINMAADNTMAKDGMSLHARIYWYLGGNILDGPPLFSITVASWAKIATGMDDILRSYPDNWNINHFLYFSCVAGDRAQAKKVLDQMMGEAIMSIWQERAVLKECKDFARGLDQKTEPGSPT